jgi:hypothetical protein
MYFQAILSVLAFGSTAFAAQLTQVSNYGGGARAKPGMFVASDRVSLRADYNCRWVYVPDQVKSDALVVAIHSCQSSAQKYFQNNKIPWKQGSDAKGYVTVWPSSTTECWDVSSKSSLSHNGGGDSNAIANMITYAIDKYEIDPKKVFVTGGSSGGKDVECNAQKTRLTSSSHDVQRPGRDLPRTHHCRVAILWRTSRLLCIILWSSSCLEQHLLRRAIRFDRAALGRCSARYGPWIQRNKAAYTILAWQR